MVIRTTLGSLNSDCAFSYPWYCTGLTSFLPGCIMSSADLDALDACNYAKLNAIDPTLASAGQKYFSDLANQLSVPGNAPGSVSWVSIAIIASAVLLLDRIL